MRARLSLLFLFTVSFVVARNPSPQERVRAEVLRLDPLAAAIVCAVLGIGLVFLLARSYRGTLVRFAASIAILFAGPAAIAESHVQLAKPYIGLVTLSCWESRPEAVLLWFVAAFLLLLAVRILGRKERRDFVSCAVGAVLVLVVTPLT